jgi:hypothetical protein
MNQLNVGGPVMAIAPLDVDETLLILTTKGVQQYDYIEDEDSETTDEPPTAFPSTSVSPVSLQNLTSD